MAITVPWLGIEDFQFGLGLFSPVSPNLDRGHTVQLTHPSILHLNILYNNCKFICFKLRNGKFGSSLFGGDGFSSCSPQSVTCTSLMRSM